MGDGYYGKWGVLQSRTFAEAQVITSQAGWLAVWLLRWLSGWLAVWLVVWLAGWLAGWLVVWPAG